MKKHFVKKNVHHDAFVQVLQNATQTTMSKFKCFKSTNHVLNTVEVSKLCLRAFDDKRYILENGINTLAYGHYSINA